MMSRQDRVEYLANVLSVAAVGDSVTREEATVLRSIVERIGADVNDMQAARGLLEGAAGYAARLPDDSARRLANIEDMVLMALADGELTADECAPIERLLAGHGFAQVDMDVLVRRAEKRRKDILQAAGASVAPVPALPARPPPLPSRPAAAPDPGKAATRTVVPPRTPPPPMRTRGGTEARGFPAERTPRRPNPPAETPRTPPPAAAPVTTCAPPPALPPSTAPSPAGLAAAPPESRLAACIRQREASPCRRAYCFGAPVGALNPWGCRLLDMDWSGRADWLRLGAFRDSDTFVLDRAAIRALLASRMPAVRACPHFSAAVAAAAADALPSRATTAGRWRHHKAETSAPGAVPITVREYRHGCDITSAVTSDGMAPTDGRDAMRIIRRTCAAAGAGGGPMDWKALELQAEIAGG